MPEDARIACLGWGSLVTDPRGLPVAGGWHSDGPSLPLEFARESGDRRLTLVIVDHDAPVQTCWSLLDVEGIDAAVDALASREGVEWKGSIGRWPVAGLDHRHSAAIGEWAVAKGLSGVVWTDLKPGFRNARGTVPTLADVVRHIGILDAAERERAAHYVLTAPAQIVTPYRAKLERLLA